MSSVELAVDKDQKGRDGWVRLPSTPEGDIPLRERVLTMTAPTQVSFARMGVMSERRKPRPSRRRLPNRQA